MAAVAGGRITAGVGANLIGQHAADRNQDATVYVGGLDPQVLLQQLGCHRRGLYLWYTLACAWALIHCKMSQAVDMQMSEELVWELFVQAGPVGTLLCSDQC